MKEQIIKVLQRLAKDSPNQTIKIYDIADEIVKLIECKNIITKVKEANTPDKRTFEEAEKDKKGLAEQITGIFEKYEVVANADYEVISADLEKLFQQTYLNDCIAKAEPNLSKIKDVDKELAEMRGQGWICPRCGKVHSWLSMTCDCEPKTITSTTY